MVDAKAVMTHSTKSMPQVILRAGIVSGVLIVVRMIASRIVMKLTMSDHTTAALPDQVVRFATPVVAVVIEVCVRMVKKRWSDERKRPAAHKERRAR